MRHQKESVGCLESQKKKVLSKVQHRVARASGLEESQVVQLDLYVVDDSPKSVLAYNNLKEICKELNGKCRINRIDLSRNPELAKEKDVLCTPLLVRRTPLPEVRIVGTLRDAEKTKALLETHLRKD